MSGGGPARSEASPGDHLQSLYHYWLVGHQLEHLRAPWRDPYTFQPEAKPQPNFAGWPFGFLYWPLSAVFGLVGGWNALQLVVYTLAGLFACAWLRELGLPRGPALAGGLVFSIAPYRVQQSVGHLLGPISILLPLSLWAFERGRRGSRWWLLLSGAAIASIPLSGQVHLALGAIPFFLVYALCRTRNRGAVIGAVIGAVGAVLAGLLVRETLIKGSTEAGGRKLAEITRYSANAGDFLARHVGQGRSEQFVFIGWVTPVVALLGFVLLLRSRRYALAAVLGVGVAMPILLALGTNTPVYSAVWHALPPFRFPRVPERLLPIACLCIAALFAFAVGRAGKEWVAALAIVVLFVDLHARVYHSSAPGNPEAVAFRGSGRLLELPVFDPSVHLGSVYLWYDTASQRERPGGYSTTAPKAAKRTADRFQRLNCGDWSGGMSAELERSGVRGITLHGGLYDRKRAVTPTDWFAWRGLEDHGWRVQRVAGPVVLFEPRAEEVSAKLPEPPHARPIFCQGWYGETGSGRYMSERHAPFWIYGNGRIQLRFAPSSLPRRVGVHNLQASGTAGQRWRLVTVDVPSLVRAPGVGKRVGLRLLEVKLR
jgi:hypothetical protein